MKWTSVLISLFTVQALAGHRVGNGGDHIRATFIKIGQSVVDFLKETEKGAQVLKKSGVTVTELESTLDIEKISVVDGELRDNSGSLVEAIGEPGSIQLQKEAWFRHFEKNQDVTYLVFHEMLRSAAVNDDNYIISAGLNPFPLSLRVDTKVVPVLPLIKEDNLKGIFELAKVQMAGSGCPRMQAKTHLDFNEEKNILEIQLSSYRNEISKTKAVERKSCSLVIPVSLPAYQRLVISQIDLAGKLDLQPGTEAQLQFEAFLANTSNPLKTRSFKPVSALSGRMLTRRTEILESNCGGTDNIRLNTSLLSKNGGSSIGSESVQIDDIFLFMTLESCRP